MDGLLSPLRIYIEATTIVADMESRVSTAETKKKLADGFIGNTYPMACEHIRIPPCSLPQKWDHCAIPLLFSTNRPVI